MAAWATGATGQGGWVARGREGALRIVCSCSVLICTDEVTPGWAAAPALLSILWYQRAAFISRVHSMRWRPVPAACPLPLRLFAILSINFLLFAGANLLHMPALASLTLNHWHPQWWQVRLA